MPQDDSTAAGREGRAEEGSQIDAGDRVLGSYGHDVCAGDLVVAVHEEGREVLAIGQRNERVKGAGAGARVGQDRLGEPKGTARLHEADFVDGNFLERCLGCVHGEPALRGAALCRLVRPCAVRAALLGMTGCFPRGVPARGIRGEAEARHPQGRKVARRAALGGPRERGD
jgi:hypothetical protein